MRSLLSTSDYLQVQEYKLSNDLTVWLNEDHSQPKIFGAVVVKAGAKDSPNTGIAHYFEHMMFKGTDKIGTVDYKSEKVLLDIIADKYDALADTTDPEMRAHLQQIINDLSVRAAEYVIPNEFDRLISRYGGTKLNAGTSYDYTLYFNTFSPQYVAQWAEINSERLLNPVFRLFQSELETVYEEKNMYGDAMANAAIEKLRERYFYPHPYAYPIIGSTENLKNPRLSEMRRFFEKYYVASNMGLILSGDFDTKEVLPILEAKFSRIRKGKVPKREAVALPPFNGREKVCVCLPMPFVKIMALGFRGVPADHPDQVALNVAVALLNNVNGTGFLDKLTLDHKVMGAMAVNESMNEAGILALLAFPKFFFQTYSSVEKLIWEQIDRIKKGDFSESVFQSLKLEQKREYASRLEDISSRAEMMMRIYSQGKSWQDYLDEVERIDALTREDVMKIAEKYFTKNYLCVTKKTGRYPKNVLPKPDYAPIIPKNSDASSAYVKSLELMPVHELKPHFIDFDKDAEKIDLSPSVSLYKTDNHINDIFSLTFCFGIGELAFRNLGKLSDYLPFIGTESMSFDIFRGKLQELGSTLEFETSDSKFWVEVRGFDNHFAETMVLVGDFFTHAKPDDKKLSQLVDDAKVIEKSLFNSSENVADILLEKIKFGDRSRFLTKLTLSDVKKLKGKSLLETFDQVRQYACDIHYCGTLPLREVAERVRAYVPIDKITIPADTSYLRTLMTYDRPTVYVMNMKNIAQSIIYAYLHIDPLMSKKERYISGMFNAYFGGDMSSLMFQEIREFRSLAYQVSASMKLPPLSYAEKPANFVMRLATQVDKTIDAMEVLDGLLRDMPERPERMKSVKQTIRNRISNGYPTCRSLSLKIADYCEQGYMDDPNKEYWSVLENITMDDIVRFYKERIQNRLVTYAIVGNVKMMDMEALAKFGQIIKVSKKDIYK